LKIVARNEDGRVVYTFADPESCRCLYVGGAKEYATYQQLALQHEVSREIDAGSGSWRLWGSW
jgi:hypothetical protein